MSCSPRYTAASATAHVGERQKLVPKVPFTSALTWKDRLVNEGVSMTTLTSLPNRSQTIGDSVVLQTLWRSVVLPALARPITRIRNRWNFLLMTVARFGMVEVQWMREKRRSRMFGSRRGCEARGGKEEKHSCRHRFKAADHQPWRGCEHNVQIDLGRRSVTYLDIHVLAVAPSGYITSFHNRALELERAPTSSLVLT